MKKFFVLSIIFFSGLCLIPEANATSPDSVCYVHYINVGQGDASLLEFSCGAILIDAGAQSMDYVDSLINFLENFFDRRQDLDNTLESVMITHNHPDHIKGLKEVIQKFNVNRLIYNGTAEGSWGYLNWAIKNADDLDITLVPVTFEIITAGNNKDGYTNNDVDPLSCSGVDPVITILSGGFESNPGWTHSEYDNEKNHSLVIRVDFHEASFIFTGDLEEDGISTVVDYYYPSGITEGPLDVDVYHVGHHGSYNATTTEWLDLISPEIAVISVGEWTYGQGTNNKFTTWWYGHPRRVTIKKLEDYLPKSKKRSQYIKPKLAKEPANFRAKKIKKKIYATAWDNNIKIRATAYGTFIVYTGNK